MVFQRVGPLMRAWKEDLLNDNSVSHLPPTTGSKRKAVRTHDPILTRLLVHNAPQDTTVDEAEIREKYNSGTLGKVTPSLILTVSRMTH
jgi:hypothetical protein